MLQRSGCIVGAPQLPMAWQVASGRHHESNFAAPLLDAALARGFRPETVATDKAYDNNRIHAECEAREVLPVIPLKGVKGKQPVLPFALGGRLMPMIPRHTQRFRDLYKGRRAAERLFGELKTYYGLTPLRVRGLAKVQLHADLTILARLGRSLLHAREAVAVAA